MYFLDSCVCIELMRGHLPFTYQLIQANSPKLFGIPSIVAAELFTGAEKSKDPKANKLKVECFLSPFYLVPFDKDCALVYAKIRADLESSGSKIGPNDLLIAACTIANNATLISGNTREFARVKELSLENWEEMNLPK